MALLALATSASRKAAKQGACRPSPLTGRTMPTLLFCAKRQLARRLLRIRIGGSRARRRAKPHLGRRRL